LIRSGNLLVYFPPARLYFSAMKTSVELEKSAALQVATLMVAAARTAPKTRGIDNIKTAAIDDEPTKQKSTLMVGIGGLLQSGRFGQNQSRYHRQPLQQNSFLTVGVRYHVRDPLRLLKHRNSHPARIVVL
jgi:hypothetical protein